MSGTGVILVTGGTGFLGSDLARALDADNRPTRVVGSKSDRTSRSVGLQYCSTDLRKIEPHSEVFNGVDTIVHLASTTIPATSMNDMVFDAQSNLEMALRLLEAARLRGIPNFVFASSGGTVYGDPVRLPAREEDPTNPISSYGVIKLAIEKYLGLYSRLHGIRGVSLRITNPYGPGQFAGAPIGVIARMLRHAHDRTIFSVWGDGSVVRDYFHIDDLRQAILVALTARVPTGVYNVGSGQGTSLNELLSLTETVTGRQLQTSYETPRSVDVANIWVDTEKFRRLTGWQPTIGLEEGLRRMWTTLLKSSGSPA